MPASSSAILRCARLLRGVGQGTAGLPGRRRLWLLNPVQGWYAPLVGAWQTVRKVLSLAARSWVKGKSSFSGCCAAGSSRIDASIPKADVTLSWATISDYVQQCRWSRVLGGVHFEVRGAWRAALHWCAAVCGGPTTSCMYVNVTCKVGFDGMQGPACACLQAATLAAVELCTPIGKAAALRAKALYAGTDTGPIPTSTL